MPFLGQDPRGSGKEYVKIQTGWVKKELWKQKLLEHLNHFLLTRILARAVLSENCGTREDTPAGSALTGIPRVPSAHAMRALVSHQPSVAISRRGVRDTGGGFTVAEILSRLEMPESVDDIRRHRYIFRLTRLLAVESLPSLAVSARNVVFNILQALIIGASQGRGNLKSAAKLLDEVETTLHANQYQHMGAAITWRRHLTQLQEMRIVLEEARRAQQGSCLTLTGSTVTLDSLPSDCIYSILSHISDPRDLLNVSASSRRMYYEGTDSLLWRQLVSFHFTPSQVEDSRCALQSEESRELPGDVDDVDWMAVCSHLWRPNLHKKKQVYADCLQLCLKCSTLSWSEIGHNCFIADAAQERDEEQEGLPASDPGRNFVTPEDFIRLCSI